MKHLLASKTFWFNLVSGVAVVSGLVPASPVTAGVAAIANIVLRMMTNQPVVPGLTAVPPSPPVGAK